MSEQPLNDLIQKYLNDAISPEELRDLQSRIVSDRASAQAFARASRIDAALTEHFAEAERIESSANVARRAVDEIHASDDYHAPRPKRTRFPAVAFALAAALLITTGIGIWFSLRPSDSANVQQEMADNGPRLLSGEALVDGRPDNPICDGSQIDVLAGSAAVQLSDGSQIDFDPESTAILRGSVGDVRQVVELMRGGGAFRVEKGNRQFRVDTPAGDVTVVGTEFNVHLQEFNSFEGDDGMFLRTFLTLAVVVTTGQVEVQINDRVITLQAGQSRVFAEGRAQPKADAGDFNRQPDFRGQFVKYDEKAGTFVVEQAQRGGEPKSTTFVAAKDVKVFVDDKPAKIGDLKDQQAVGLFLNEDKTTILAIKTSGAEVRQGVVREVAEGERKGARGERDLFYGLFQKYDEQAGSITVTVRGDRGSAEKSSTFTVAKDVKAEHNDQSIKLSEIPANSRIGLKLNDDRTSVVAVRIELNPTRQIIMEIDAEKSTVSFKVEKKPVVFAVAKDAKIVIDNKPGTVADLKPAMVCFATFSLDGKTVTAIQSNTVGKGREGDRPAVEGGERKGVRPVEGGERKGDKAPEGGGERKGVRPVEGGGERKGEKAPEGGGQRKPE